ncbi:hypothetical protein BsWGS_15075 [Bradybaena similaris]
MPETSVSTRQLSEDFDDVDGKHTANNDIPPLPKKMQPRSILSKTKMADLTRGNAENAGSDPSQTEDMTEQAGSGVFEMTRLKVFCTDIPNYGYLTPTDPPTYNEFHERGTAPAGCSTTDKIVLRVDSAIGPEPARGPGNAYSSTPPPVSPASLLSAARLSAQYNLPYEDIDHYTLIHEDGNRSSDRHQWPSTISGGPDDVSHAYLQFSTHKFPDSSQRFTRQRGAECWIVVSLIVILVVSMTALSLSVYQLVSPSSKPAQISQNLKQTLINMEWTLDNLITETEALKGAMRTQVTDLTFLTEDKIVPVTSQLKNLSLMIESTNDKFAAQIANTSLTPGPQVSMIRSQYMFINYVVCFLKHRNVVQHQRQW